MLYDGHLIQSPVLPSGDALPTARDGHVGDVFRVRLEGDGVVELRGAPAGQTALAGEFAPTPTDEPLVTVRLIGDRVTVIRRGAGVPNHFGDERAATLRPQHTPNSDRGPDGGAAPHHIDVIVDHSAIEVFADDGAAVFSLRAFGAFTAEGAWTVRVPR